MSEFLKNGQSKSVSTSLSIYTNLLQMETIIDS